MNANERRTARRACARSPGSPGRRGARWCSAPPSGWLWLGWPCGDGRWLGCGARRRPGRGPGGPVTPSATPPGRGFCGSCPAQPIPGGRTPAMPRGTARGTRPGAAGGCAARRGAGWSRPDTPAGAASHTANTYLGKIRGHEQPGTGARRTPQQTRAGQALERAPVAGDGARTPRPGGSVPPGGQGIWDVTVRPACEAAGDALRPADQPRGNPPASGGDAQNGLTTDQKSGNPRPAANLRGHPENLKLWLTPSREPGGSLRNFSHDCNGSRLEAPFSHATIPACRAESHGREHLICVPGCPPGRSCPQDTSANPCTGRSPRRAAARDFPPGWPPGEARIRRVRVR